MSDWNDMYFDDRDGLPRGYVLAARDQFEPVAPANWMRFDGDIGVQAAVMLADEHRLTASACDPMDVRVLARRYAMMKNAGTVAARSWMQFTFSPMDAYVHPKGLAAKVFVAGTRTRGDVALLCASVGRRPQEANMVSYPSNDIDHDARSAWLSTRDIDQGRAWSTEHWECFTSPAFPHYLQILLVNPHHAEMDVEIVVFYQGYSVAPLGGCHGVPTRRRGPGY